MAKLSKREKERIRRVLGGIENLVELGGFIEEEIKEEICSMYYDEVISYTEKYCSIGPGFFEVADAVEQAMDQSDKYEKINANSCKNPFVVLDTEFQEWLLSQVARIESEKVKKKEKSFWSDWKLTPITKRVLQKFNAVEERVLYLSHGVAEEEAMSAEQIAAMPEFSCGPEYIEKIIKIIENELKCSKWCNQEFHQVCDAMKKGGKKDGGYELFS